MLKRVVFLAMISTFFQSCVLYDLREVNSDVTDKYSTKEKEEYIQQRERAGYKTRITIP